MATVDKDQIREWKRDSGADSEDRAKRLDEYADAAAEANDRLDSPPGATGPGWVPPAGGDPDTAMRSAKVQEAVDDVVLAANRRSSGRDDWERATDVKARRSSKSTDDSDGPETPQDGSETAEQRAEREKREAAEKRAADADTSGQGQAATVRGRGTAPKSTTS